MTADAARLRPAAVEIINARKCVRRPTRSSTGIDLTIQPGHGHGDPGPVRLRQVHPAAGDQPPGEARLRLCQRQRRADRRATPRRPAQGAAGAGDPAPAAPDRLRLPELQPVPASDRAGERHRGADRATGEAPGRGREAAALELLGAGRARRQGSTPIRGSCPAASSSGSRSPGRWPWSRSHPVRRAHLGARPGTGRRGARRHQGSRQHAAPRWSWSPTRSASPARSPTESSSSTSGRIVEQGPPAEVLDNPTTERAASSSARSLKQ